MLHRRRTPTLFSFLVISLCLSTFFSSCSSQQAYISHLPKQLILALDGVSFQQFTKMQEAGYFRNFKPAARMLATFPSISDPNWSLISGSEKSVSYTKAYIDLDSATQKGTGEVVGGLISHLSSPPEYESKFDFKPEGFLEHLFSIAWSDTSGVYWLDSMEKSFFWQTKPTFSVFVVNTDIMAHTRGEDSLAVYLHLVDQKIKKMQSRYFDLTGETLEVVIISDHGNYFEKPQSIDFAPTLAEAGFTPNLPFEKKLDYGFYAPEILSFASFFCDKNQKNFLAKTLSTVPGVHSAMYENKDGDIEVVSDEGNSLLKIHVDEKNKTVKLDLLKGKAPFPSQVKLQTTLDIDKYFSDTIDDDYPFAAYRAWQAFHVVQKPGMVLVNPKLGFAFANRTLELITAFKGLHSSHGSLHKAESFGVIVSTKKEFDPTNVGHVFAQVFYDTDHRFTAKK